MSPHQLAQVAAAAAGPEPLQQPGWLVSDDDDVVIWAQALLNQVGEVPAGGGCVFRRGHVQRSVCVFELEACFGLAGA